MIDRFRKGKRVYTHWDKKTEQVTVVPRAKGHGERAAAPVAADANGYADESVIAHNGDEFVIDLIASSREKCRVVSRVIMSPGTAKRFAALLAKELA